MSTRRRLLIALGGGGFSLAGLCAGGWFALNEPLPTMTDRARGDLLAREVEAAINIDAWKRTGAVSWRFRERNRHLWDRQRNLVRVEWDDVEVSLDIGRKDGRARRGGQPVTGEAATALFEDAFSRWANDSFWLNPLEKLFDDGTQRGIVTVGGQEALMVQYASGGVTPGDSYVWILGPDKRPVAWKMWVSIIPIGGVKTSWEGWRQLSTGAWVAPLHQGDIGFSLELTEIEAAATLTELTGGVDPFQPLFSL